MSLSESLGLGSCLTYSVIAWSCQEEGKRTKKKEKDVSNQPKA